MLTLFTGSPGAGKTASLVDFLSKLPGDRPLFVDGLNGLTLPHTVCNADNWQHDLPEGAILVIDEVQRVWRPRGAGSKVPDSVAALETHRHRGIDVFMTTQAPRLLDANVRGLIGRHVHIRDTGVLGRYWYEWPECNDSMAWKTCINKKRISLPKKAFSLYKSASLHTVPVRGVPRALLVGLGALVLLSVLVYGVYKIYDRTQGGGVVSSPVAPVPVVHPALNPGGDRAARDVTKIIDDRVDWIPRVSSRPESAPAYDHLRQVKAMPTVTAGYCQGQSCKCYTNQGTNPGLSVRECREFVENRPWDPYRESVQSASRDGQNQPVTGPDRPSPLASVL